MPNETGWEYLLSLHGTVFFVDESLGYWVKFIANQVPITQEMPHGVSYSITLHNRRGARILGFDNAHRIGKQSKLDHWHKTATDTGRSYPLESAEQLLADFWREVDRIVKESHDE